MYIFTKKYVIHSVLCFSSIGSAPGDVLWLEFFVFTEGISLGFVFYAIYVY